MLEKSFVFLLRMKLSWINFFTHYNSCLLQLISGFFLKRLHICAIHVLNT